MPAPRIPNEVRWARKTERAASGCLLYTAGLDNDGYGAFKSEVGHRPPPSLGAPVRVRGLANAAGDLVLVPPPTGRPPRAPLTAGASGVPFGVRFGAALAGVEPAPGAGVVVTAFLAGAVLAGAVLAGAALRVPSGATVTGTGASLLSKLESTPAAGDPAEYGISVLKMSS